MAHGRWPRLALHESEEDMTAKRILLGHFEREWLASLARLPRRALNGWAIAEAIEAHGLSTSVRGSHLDRVHTITDAGRTWLRDNPRKT